LHYLHNNVLVIDQSELREDRPVPWPFPAFPMTKREKPWERGWYLPVHLLLKILACTKRRNVETKRPKRNGQNHRNHRNDRNETTETKRPKRNGRNETAENINYRKNGKY
jgi:hypothetical protein